MRKSLRSQELDACGPGSRVPPHSAPRQTSGRIAMKVYLGQTRERKLIAQLNSLGFGEMTCRGELPPRRTPWAMDNGAFRDWTNQKPFNQAQFRKDVAKIAKMETKPDFIVLPDIVGAGELS